MIDISFQLVLVFTIPYIDDIISQLFAVYFCSFSV